MKKPTETILNKSATAKQTKKQNKRKAPKGLIPDEFEEFTPSKKIGRPRIEFDAERAKNLMSLGFTMGQVSNALGISYGTLRRFRSHESCVIYDKVSDEELDEMILKIKKDHPQMGEKRLRGLLKGQGFRIQRKRLRESIHRVDPDGPKQRCNAGITLVNSRTSMGETRDKPKAVKEKRTETAGIQVPANCPAPNSIWRIDTIDKLERWKIGITLGLDMFSRLMVFVLASNVGNKHAQNIETAFKSSVSKYSYPELITTDERDEKVLVWRAMVGQKGDTCVEMSLKLERVQWVTIIKNDINTNLFTPLIDTFTQLEMEGSLNVSNDTDLFCLHFVYLPRINKLLQDFSKCYNSCAIPRGSGATPSQIFYAHNEAATMAQSDILPNLINSSSDIDISLQSTAPILSKKFEELKQHVNPLEESSDNGKELYYRTGTFVTECLKSFIDTNDAVDAVSVENNIEFHAESIGGIPLDNDDVKIIVQSKGNDDQDDLNQQTYIINMDNTHDDITEESAKEILRTLITQNVAVNNSESLIQDKKMNMGVVSQSVEISEGNQQHENIMNIDPSSLIVVNASDVATSMHETTNNVIEVEAEVLDTAY